MKVYPSSFFEFLKENDSNFFIFDYQEANIMPKY